MTTCCICNESEADKLGSHVVPAFMLNSMIGKRNNEVGFLISSKGFVEKYIGREVTPEKIESALGRELTDEDIEHNKNLFTEDNLVCTRCEKRLAVLESRSSIILKSLKEKDFQNGELIDYFEVQENLLLRVLFLSILYRMGSAPSFHYDLNKALGIKVRALLDKVISEDQEELEANLKKYKAEIIDIPIALIYSPIAQNDDSTQNNVIGDKSSPIPAAALINEFILFAYNSRGQIGYKFDSLISIDREVVQAMLNYKEENLRIGVIEDREKINKYLTDLLASASVNNLANMFTQVYLTAKGIMPSQEQLREFVVNLTSEEIPLHDKLTIENIARVMHKHLAL